MMVRGKRSFLVVIVLMAAFFVNASALTGCWRVGESDCGEAGDRIDAVQADLEGEMKTFSVDDDGGTLEVTITIDASKSAALERDCQGDRWKLGELLVPNAHAEDDPCAALSRGLSGTVTAVYTPTEGEAMSLHEDLPVHMYLRDMSSGGNAELLPEDTGYGLELMQEDYSAQVGVFYIASDDADSLELKTYGTDEYSYSAY